MLGMNAIENQRRYKLWINNHLIKEHKKSIVYEQILRLLIMNELLDVATLELTLILSYFTIILVSSNEHRASNTINGNLFCKIHYQLNETIVFSPYSNIQLYLRLNRSVFSFEYFIKGTPFAINIISIKPIGWKLKPLLFQYLLTISVCL